MAFSQQLGWVYGLFIAAALWAGAPHTTMVTASVVFDNNAAGCETGVNVTWTAPVSTTGGAGTIVVHVPDFVAYGVATAAFRVDVGLTVSNVLAVDSPTELTVTVSYSGTIMAGDTVTLHISHMFSPPPLGGFNSTTSVTVTQDSLDVGNVAEGELYYSTTTRQYGTLDPFGGNSEYTPSDVVYFIAARNVGPPGRSMVITSLTIECSGDCQTQQGLLKVYTYQPGSTLVRLYNSALFNVVHPTSSPYHQATIDFSNSRTVLPPFSVIGITFPSNMNRLLVVPPGKCAQCFGGYFARENVAVQGDSFVALDHLYPGDLTVVVTRDLARDENRLASFGLLQQTLVPAFNPNVTLYTVRLLRPAQLLQSALQWTVMPNSKATAGTNYTTSSLQSGTTTRIFVTVYPEDPLAARRIYIIDVTVTPIPLPCFGFLGAVAEVPGQQTLFGNLSSLGYNTNAWTSNGVFSPIGCLTFVNQGWTNQLFQMNNAISTSYTTRFGLTHFRFWFGPVPNPVPGNGLIHTQPSISASVSFGDGSPSVAVLSGDEIAFPPASATYTFTVIADVDYSAYEPGMHYISRVEYRVALQDVTVVRAIINAPRSVTFPTTFLLPPSDFGAFAVVVATLFNCDSWRVMVVSSQMDNTAGSPMVTLGFIDVQDGAYANVSSPSTQTLQNAFADAVSDESDPLNLRLQTLPQWSPQWAIDVALAAQFTTTSIASTVSQVTPCRSGLWFLAGDQDAGTRCYAIAVPTPSSSSSAPLATSSSSGVASQTSDARVNHVDVALVMSLAAIAAVGLEWVAGR